MTYSGTGCVYEILNKTTHPYSGQTCKPVCHPAAEGLTSAPHFTRCTNAAEAVTTEYDAVFLNCGTNPGAEEQEFTVLEEHKSTILVYADSPFNGLLTYHLSSGTGKQSANEHAASGYGQPEMEPARVVSEFHRIDTAVRPLAGQYFAFSSSSIKLKSIFSFILLITNARQ